MKTAISLSSKELSRNRSAFEKYFSAKIKIENLLWKYLYQI